ncbi:hypothetical protein Sjap_002060 [Stephania japonica]|uniref:GPN-loop GTPase 2 n=1 Tax=Stephania japonica TaxID=461633 RepID=A0AAP0KM21_9MAGN
MAFGQVVIGPPGSGKTTYCNGMSQFLKLIGRKVAVINLDPANDALPFECAVNIEDLIKLEDVMNEHSLGPNGGLVYCMDYLQKNIDWLESKLLPFIKDHYLLFDFPGQVELFSVHTNVKNIINKLMKKLDLRLTCIHLVDAHLCSDAGKYVSALLLSLSTMIHLELPHINVLSKIDLIESYGKLGPIKSLYILFLFKSTSIHDLFLLLAFFMNANDFLFQLLTLTFTRMFKTYPIYKSVANLVKLIDKSNGYIFAGIEGSAVEYSKIAAGPLDWEYYRYPFSFSQLYYYINFLSIADVQEKYMKDDENFNQ